ncbi:hypothetical protein Pyn_28241 [Prunus yedoensis var. nudiflora]|uniref:Uncharacterized protein n=1 Tax=Prunus yedoensis var. nudiflora TaxID=2094558 RepID=A0A314YMA1_PRUYE|nr:hypothetical protein Pyn_35861 [Prunus yedoensis var. nudiflora]PQQ09705.1 hypothetical protein Pyn_28241 [Prunus yedoensis var. nudiflora]
MSEVKLVQRALLYQSYEACISIECLNEFAFSLKDVRTYVYYIVSEYGSNGISMASSNGQTLKLVHAAVQ